MSNARRVYIMVVVFVATISFLNTPTLYGKTIRTPDETLVYQGDALLLDAQQYATDYNVSLEEALRRLRLQDSIGLLDAELAEKERDTFAGLWLEHSPRFQVIVQFTRNGAERAWPYIQNGPLADMVEVRAAKVTLAELQAIQTATWSAVYNLGIPLDHDINVFQNQVELYVTNSAQFSNALERAIIQLPEHVEIIQVDSLSRETADIYGGLPLVPVCTTGFSVITTSGLNKGIMTAGHCQNTLSYNGQNLPFVSESWGGSYDVQWHNTPGFTVRNWAWDGSWNRIINGQRHRDNQFIGDFVCKYGKTTGGGCGTITSKTFNGTYIRVHSNTVDLAEPGDSGGPWFSGSTAFGIMTGDIEPGNDAYYMAINYMSTLGILVLTN